MIKKEDFVKSFPLKVNRCTVDDVVSEGCVLDDGMLFDCSQSYAGSGLQKKEDCKYWKEVDNWAFIEDVWDWIDNYQKENK